MLTCTSPPSSTLLASSRRLQLLKMVLLNFLWSAAQASTDVQGFPLERSIPANEKHSATRPPPKKKWVKPRGQKEQDRWQ